MRAQIIIILAAAALLAGCSRSDVASFAIRVQNSAQNNYIAAQEAKRSTIITSYGDNTPVVQVRQPEEPEPKAAEPKVEEPPKPPPPQYIYVVPSQ